MESLATVHSLTAIDANKFTALPILDPEQVPINILIRMLIWNYLIGHNSKIVFRPKEVTFQADCMTPEVNFDIALMGFRTIV